MTRLQNPLGTDWPLQPDVNAFAQKGASDGSLLNASASHLQTGLDYIKYQAQADLVLSDGSAAEVATTSQQFEVEDDSPSKWSRARDAASTLRSWAGLIFRLTVLVVSAILGVGVTERAFDIFNRSPIQTRAITIMVELLFVYSAYMIGARMRTWPRAERIGKVVTLALFAATAMAALAVAFLRVLAIGVVHPQVSLSVKFAMFSGLALLLIVAAIDAGIHGLKSAPKSEGNTSIPAPKLQPADPGLNGHTNDAIQDRDRTLTRETGRRSQWMACLFAYLHAYRGAAAPELMPELEAVEPEDIPFPMRRSSDVQKVVRRTTP